jgi:hypothetical protein
MILVSAVATVALFLVAFRVLGVAAIAATALAATRQATAVMADGTLGEEAKEQAVRQASKRLMLLFLDITLRSALVLALPALALLLADSLGFVSFAVVTAFLLRWEVIAISALATTGAAILWR